MDDHYSEPKPQVVEQLIPTSARKILTKYEQKIIQRCIKVDKLLEEKKNVQINVVTTEISSLVTISEYLKSEIVSMYVDHLRIKLTKYVSLL